MDAGTPQNPNKPRLSRRLLSHFTLTLSVLLALSFVTMAVVGPTTETAEGKSWEEVAVVTGTNAAAGAAIGFAVADGLGAVLGAAGGAIIGSFLAMMGQDKGEAAFSGAIAAYANALKNITDDYFGLALDAAGANYNTLWNTSQYYLIQKAQWAAQQLYDYQIANGLSTVYDPYYVLSRSEVANATTGFTWAMGQQFSAILNSHSDLASTFVGTYDGMKWGLIIGGEESLAYNKALYTSSAPDSKANRLCEFLSVAYCDSSNKYVTVSANSDIYLANTHGAESTKVMKIKARNGTEVWSESVTLSANQYITINLAELGYPSGDYYLSYHSADGMSVNDFRWFGQFSNAITSSGDIYPALLSFVKDGEEAKLDFFGILYNNKMYGAGGGYYFVSRGSGEIYAYFDADTNYRSQFTDALRYMGEMLNRTAEMQTTANNFAQSYYNYLVVNGPDAPRIMPSIMFPDPSQLEGMSWQQIYAMLLAYLTQMDPWFEDHTVMGQDNVNISAESLDLLCRGAIYNASGGIVYNDTAVWTPYISLEDMTLTAGQNNTMTQPGFVIVWGHADALANFSQPTACVYVPVTVGWNLSIEEMTLKGAQVTETTLTVTKIKWVVYEPGGNITMPQGLNDLDWIIDHWYYLAIIGGVICLLGAIATRNMPILAAGLVLMAAGAIGWYLAGDTSLLSWLSMEPLNLRAWLQDLR